MIPPLFGWNRFIFEGFGTTCTFDYISKGVWDRLYMLILVIDGFLIPLLIILISYTFILIKLSKRARYFMYQNSDNQTHELQSRYLNGYYFHPTNCLNDEQSRNGTPLEPNVNNLIAQNLHHTEVRVTRTALLVCAIYCTAWGPYALMTILSQFGFNDFINAYTTAMLGLFTKTAACVNPLVYALSSSAFHRQICAYVKVFYTCRRSNHTLLLSNYESNRKNVTFKSNQLGTLSNSFHY
jgi:r-opsin